MTDRVPGPFTDPEDRLPPLSPAAWTEAQRVCAEEIIQGPHGSLIEPFRPLLRSPELCTHVQRTGEYLRYRSAIGLRLSELAILVTACHWVQQVEWSIHAPIAMREGIAPEVVEALAAGTPVVQPDVCGFREIIEATGGGLLCPQNTPASLAGTLGEVLSDPARLRSLGEQGRRAVAEKFSDAAMAREVLAATRSLLEERPGSGSARPLSATGPAS